MSDVRIAKTSDNPIQMLTVCFFRLQGLVMLRTDFIKLQSEAIAMVMQESDKSNTPSQMTSKPMLFVVNIFNTFIYTTYICMFAAYF